jgi:DNA-binding HxlR family transcriptional regulator
VLSTGTTTGSCSRDGSCPYCEKSAILRQTMNNLPRDQLLHCAIPAALEAVGERWSFLILRGVFNGLHHFEEFQSTLGIARNILSNRLGRMVANGVLERQPDKADRRKVSYELTDKGRALLPVLIALRQWGERWVSGVPCNPVLVDSRSRKAVAPMTVRASDGRELSLDELEWIDRAEVEPG